MSEDKKEVAPSMELLSETHFKEVLNRVVKQVFEGKGKERHGQGIRFQNQPWRIIADNISSKFLEGQAVKKIFELKNMQNFAAYEREILGAIVYLVMALMYEEYINTKSF